MLRRAEHAFTFLTLPDEIVAEQYLRENFPQFFEARTAYYLDMRRSSKVAVESPQSDASLQPFAILYEGLRNAFFRELLSEGECERELRQLESVAEDRLLKITPAELGRGLLELKPRLLNVSYDGSLDEAQTAYDELFARIMALTGP